MPTGRPIVRYHCRLPHVMLIGQSIVNYHCRLPGDGLRCAAGACRAAIKRVPSSLSVDMRVPLRECHATLTAPFDRPCWLLRPSVAVAGVGPRRLRVLVRRDAGKHRGDVE